MLKTKIITGTIVMALAVGGVTVLKFNDTKLNNTTTSMIHYIQNSNKTMQNATSKLVADNGQINSYKNDLSQANQQISQYQNSLSNDSKKIASLEARLKAEETFDQEGILQGLPNYDGVAINQTFEKALRTETKYNTYYISELRTAYEQIAACQIAGNRDLQLAKQIQVEMDAKQISHQVGTIAIIDYKAQANRDFAQAESLVPAYEAAYNATIL